MFRLQNSIPLLSSLFCPLVSKFMFWKFQTMEDNESPKPKTKKKKKQNQRFLPKRGQVMINILEEIFGKKIRGGGGATATSVQSQEDNGGQKHRSASPNSAVSAATPVVYMSDADPSLD
ncbi:hypothetical protein Ddye_025003 [Dipteronia dyeriana]|uniref:Uncharacterized protein n=1 Tax=Dipteronia dyeriana TaxID=168575 RepID=A0AAD9TWY4_9ROSI|nr:hypothetical protein Ddye_025003 [Dipteronia dyeriana]